MTVLLTVLFKTEHREPKIHAGYSLMLDPLRDQSIISDSLMPIGIADFLLSRADSWANVTYRQFTYRQKGLIWH
jgi:hypothetical protein